MLAGKRAVRIGEQIYKEVALLLIEKVKDPRVRGVTITGIRVSDDLKLARIYFSVFGENEKVVRAMAGLNSARGFIRKEIGMRLALKYVPEITFIHDPSLETGNRLERLLDGLESNESERTDK